MTPAQLSRLERLEKFMDALVMRSFVAKAASEGQRFIADDVTANDLVLAEAARTHVQIDNLKARVGLLEQPLNNASTERTTMAKAATPPYFLTPRPTLRDAKQISAIARNAPEVDANTMGAIDGFLAIGDIAEAEAMLAAAQGGTVVKASDPADPSLTAPPASGPDMAAIVSAIDDLKLTVARLGIRVGQLETRRPVPTTSGRTVAKAGNASKPKRFRNAEDLHAMIDAFVDHPSTAGAISSLIAAGRLDEAEQHLLAAKRNHEALKAQSERKAMSR